MGCTVSVGHEAVADSAEEVLCKYSLHLLPEYVPILCYMTTKQKLVCFRLLNSCCTNFKVLVLHSLHFSSAGYIKIQLLSLFLLLSYLKK